MKRLFDVVIASAALAVCALPMLAVALAVRLVLGRPVLFMQERSGRHGMPFKLVKFRTMREAFDENGRSLPDEQRMTRLGWFLRTSSLDELPELFHVLKGDMSLVGPRPLLMEYSPLYTPEQARRLTVRPGITGWAQVNGRNALSWEEKFRLDVWYVENRSMRLDVLILWMTLLKVLCSQGIAAVGDATMPRFTGSAERARESPLVRFAGREARRKQRRPRHADWTAP